jgi:hypothetical protein
MAEPDDKAKRLAEKLRENLRKRKAQARAQAVPRRAESADDTGENAD